MASSDRDVRAEIYAAADRQVVPRELLLALCIAESECNPRAERWGRHNDAALTAIAADDMEDLEHTIALINVETPGDISFGITQQTWRWSGEYDGTNRPRSILAFRDKYFDIKHALEVAAKRIKPFLNLGDLVQTLCRYNKPNATPTPATVKRYSDSLRRAVKIIAEETTVDSEFWFDGGFLALADELGRDVVGDPIENEKDLTSSYRVQMTTKGMMVYSKEGNRAHFFEGAQL
jgi:hypothetical protein